MPFDGADFKPGQYLSPTISNLAYVLRTPSLWPKGFTWNYKYCDTCALGLMNRLWPDISNNYDNWRERLQAIGMRDMRAAHRIFIRGNNNILGTIFKSIVLGRHYLDDVQPTHIADAIDKHLKKV